MNVLEMMVKYNLTPKGVIQVGSHHGEEIPLWNEMGILHMHFEPIFSNWIVLKHLYPEALAWNWALGNETKHVTMYTEGVNGGQSCSILRPKKHLEILPWIVFVGEEEVSMVRLDDSGITTTGYNFMYVDAQGFEPEIFKGAIETLKHIDFIFTEINRAEVFEGCAHVDELDRFLEDQGFHRVETEWHGEDFGDALYVR